MTSAHGVSSTCWSQSKCSQKTGQSLPTIGIFRAIFIAAKSFIFFRNFSSFISLCLFLLKISFLPHLKLPRNRYSSGQIRIVFIIQRIFFILNSSHCFQLPIKGQIFGVPLVDLIERCNNDAGVPNIVFQCANYIRQHGMRGNYSYHGDRGW